MPPPQPHKHYITVYTTRLEILRINKLHFKTDVWNLTEWPFTWFVFFCLHESASLLPQAKILFYRFTVSHRLHQYPLCPVFLCQEITAVTYATYMYCVAEVSRQPASTSPHVIPLCPTGRAIESWVRAQWRNVVWCLFCNISLLGLQTRAVIAKVAQATLNFLDIGACLLGSEQLSICND